MAPNLKKKRYLLVVVLVVFGTLLGFLPFFLSSGPVLHFAVSKINSRIPGNLNIGSWLIGWQQGVLCQDITYVNPEKGIRVIVPRLTSTQGLLELVLSQKNLGQIALESPVIELTDRQGAKRSLPVDKAGSTSRTGTESTPVWENLSVQVEVRDGQVRVVSRNLERETGIKDIVLHSSLSDSVVEFDMGFHLIHDQGSVDLTGTLNLPVRQSTWLDTLVTEAEVSIAGLQVKDFLALAALKTNLPTGQGILSGDIEFKATGLDSIKLSGSADVIDLRLAGGLLGQDTPSFQRIHVDIDEAGWSKQRWAFTHLSIDSDAGTLQAESRHGSGRTTLSGKGKVNIPVLFDQFPHLLKLQESTLIETGELDFDVDLAVSDRKINLDFKGRAESLGGLYEGQPFSWDKPVTVVLVGERVENEVNVSRFMVEAPFVQALGHGNLSAFDLEATADLDQTFVELSKLFRLQWTGSGKMNMTVKASALSADDERYRINADFNIDDFSLSKGDRVIVPKHNLSLVGSGHAPVSMLQKRHGNVDLQFALSSWLGEIFLALDADRRKNGSWVGSYSTDTNINLYDMAAFMHLVETLPPTIKMTGDLQVQAAGNFNDAYLGIRELETVISGFALDRDGIVFEDRNINIHITQSVNGEVSSLIVHDLVVSENREDFIGTGAGTTGINFRDHSLYLHNIALDSGLGNSRIEHFIIHDWKKPLDRFASKIVVSADLTKLTPLLYGTDFLAKDIKLAGKADFLLNAADKSNKEHEVYSEVHFAEFSLSKQDKKILTEQDAKFSASLVGNLTSGNLELKRLLLTSAPLGLEAHGFVIRTENRNEIELQGDLTPDLAAIGSIVRNSFDLDLVMKGKKSESFSVRYPLGKLQEDDRKEKASLTATISADSVGHKGIDVRSLNLPVHFKNNNLHLEMAGTLNGGTLNLLSDCDFRGEPPMFMIPENSQVLTDVQLEKPLVEGLLKGIHPLFGLLTEPSGNIDLHLNSFTWPLIKKGGKDAVFVTVIDTSEVSLNSSKLLKSILAGFGLEHEKLRLRDSEIVCSGQVGRITCSPVRILIADSEMVVSGSVGMDKSLDYLLQVPVTKKLVGKEGYRLLEGTTVNIPLRGTTDKPVFDKKLVSATIKDLMEQVASKVVIEQAEKVLPALIQDVLGVRKKK